MQVNTQIFVELPINGHQVWAGPIKIFLSSILLWFYIGPAVFAGLVAMAILMAVNSLFLREFRKAEEVKIKLKDSKMKILNDILNGIKCIKFYGWEISFQNLVDKIRKSELKVIRKTALLFSCFNFSFDFTSFAVI